MLENLLIIGAGSYGRVARETAEAMGCFGKIDFLDDNNPTALDKPDAMSEYSSDYSRAFVAIGNPGLRLRFLEELEAAGYTLAALIHPSAVVMPSAELGAGCIVEANAVVNSGTVVSVGCIISAGAVINHDCMIEKGCHIDCNATVPARMCVPANTKIQCGTVYTGGNE